jgi:membrane protein
MTPAQAWSLLKRAFADFQADSAARLGASLAYYTLFSLAPLLLAAIAIAGLFFGQSAAEGRLVGELEGVVGEAGAQAVRELLENARSKPAGVAATLVALVTLLVGASGVFLELKGALNTVWDVENPPGGMLAMLRNRLAAFALVLAVGFLLLVALVVSAALSALGNLVGSYVETPKLVLELANTLVSFAVITLLFAMLFKFLPDTEVAWKDVWVGAAITSVLFAIGKFLIGLYLGRSSVTSAYGAAGSVVVLMLWVYYAGQIFYFGAELTQAYARGHDAARPKLGRRAQRRAERPAAMSDGRGRDRDGGSPAAAKEA